MANWKKLEDMTYLGKEYTRLDGAEKVSGKAKYSYDIKLPGMLQGRILRSPYPHAKIVSIDSSKVEALSGVKAVLTDIKEEVNFAGDDVAAVAAETEEIAAEALKLFKIKYEVLPYTVDETAARKADAPKVFTKRENNLGQNRDKSSGDIAQGFAEADVTVEGTFHANVQVHTPLETHGCVTKWDGDDIYVWDSTQGVHGVRSGLAKALDMPENKVHIITHHMGGGFGSKFGPKSYNIIMARLAKKAGVPIKYMLDREEELLATGNRPSSIQKIKIGAKKDGTLTAFQMESYGTGGIGGGAGTPQPYIYHFPHVEVKHNDVHINAGPGAPMRAPGHPPANFGMESIMDELAEKLHIDPLDLRLKNDPNKTRQSEWKIAAYNFGWEKRKPSGSQKGTVVKGMGLGAGTWEGGGHKRGKAIVSIFPDGSVEAKMGTQDIGVGTRTYVCAVVAEELGLDYKDITSAIGESDFPWANSSGGSMTAPTVAPTIKLATEKAKAELLGRVAEHFATDVNNITLAEKKFSVKDQADKSLAWKEACALLDGQPISVQEGWAEGLSSRGTAGCQFAEVEVDTETGHVKVVKMTAVQDCGLVLNKLTAESQVQGAIIGEIGYAMYENRLMDKEAGLMVNAEFENYKIPGALEMPEFDITFFDESHRGVIGLGEPPAIPGIGAIANAVRNAIGVPVKEMPITPDKVLMAIESKKEGKA
jgi:xanthine dehydrogenase YagR molybdenum-binding subunit